MKINPVSLVVVICAVLILATTPSAVNPPIAFQYTETYQYIWKDRGSGAKLDVSFWRPIEYEPHYYALGDVVHSTHSKPNSNAMVVKSLVAGSLTPPLSFTEVWNDRGSGAHQDVRIMRMNPSRGYTCLGHVAVLGYSTTPNRHLYRCVKSQYVKNGQYTFAWNDRRSGAKRDVTVYHNSKGSSLYGIDTNTFTAFATYSNPRGAPKILDGRYAKLKALLPLPTQKKALKVYQGSDMVEIWNDRGSGASYDISVWRSRGPSGSFSLGDLANGAYSRPQASFVVKDTSAGKNVLRPPYGYRRIWKDSGSGARWDGAFWEPLCTSGYRALGYVAIRNHGGRPPTSAMRCVKGEHTVRGRWQWVWNDRRSGAHRDVTVYRAKSLSTNGITTNPMAAIASYSSMHRPAYVLKTTSVQFVKGKPAHKYLLTNVNYLFDDRKIVKQNPENLLRTTIINKGRSPQTVSRSIRYSYTEKFDWSFGSSLEIGVSIEVEAGIPLIGKSTVRTSVTKKLSSEVSESTSKTKTDTTTANVKVQCRSQKDVIITANRYTANIPYTATLTTIYADNTRSTRSNYRGIFRGVQINQVRVVFEPDIPINP